MVQVTQSVALRVPLIAYLTSDHVSPATGKTIAVTISKNGGSFGNPSGGATNATEVSAGLYYVDLSTTDTESLGPLVVKGAEGTIDTIFARYQVVAAGTAPTSAEIADAVWDEATSGHTTAGTFGKLVADIASYIDTEVATLVTNVASLVTDMATLIARVIGLKKNTAFASFQFLMTDDVLHEPLTGLVDADFTKTYSLDGAAGAALSGTITEVDATSLPGFYQISLTAGELNGNNVALRFVASGADATNLTVVTQR